MSLVVSAEPRTVKTREVLVLRVVVAVVSSPGRKVVVLGEEQRIRGAAGRLLHNLCIAHYPTPNRPSLHLRREALHLQFRLLHLQPLPLLGRHFQSLPTRAANDPLPPVATREGNDPLQLPRNQQLQLWPRTRGERLPPHWQSRPWTPDLLQMRPYRRASPPPR